jgi:hypothetical protein
VRRGDVITQVDGQPLESARDFFERLERTTAGQELELTTVRNRETKKVTVRAEQIPQGFVTSLVSDLLGSRSSPPARRLRRERGARGQRRGADRAAAGTCCSRSAAAASATPRRCAARSSRSRVCRAR